MVDETMPVGAITIEVNEEGDEVVSTVEDVSSTVDETRVVGCTVVVGMEPVEPASEDGCLSSVFELEVVDEVSVSVEAWLVLVPLGLSVSDLAPKSEVMLSRTLVNDRP